MTTFTSEEKKRLRELSVNEIELTVRAANLLNTLNITKIGQLIDNCTAGGEYTGLTGATKGIRGISINYEAASILKELGVVADISHLKKPDRALLPPNTERMSQIAQKSSVSLSLKVSEVEWTNEELRCFSYNINGKNFDVARISDIILEFVRVSNEGHLMPLKKLGMLENRLIEWSILEPQKPKRNRAVISKVSLYERLVSHYTESPLREECEKFDNFARVQNKLPVDYKTVRDRLAAFENLVDKTNSLMNIKELLNSDPTLPNLDDVPKHVRKILNRLQDKIDKAKSYFTEEKIEYYRTRLRDRNSERVYLYFCPSIYLTVFTWSFRPRA